MLLRRSPEFLFASAVVARESADLRRAESMVDAAVASYPLAPAGWLGVKAQVLLDEDRLDELDQHVEEWIRRGRDELGAEEREFVALIQSMTQLARHQPSQAAALISAIPAENTWPVDVLLIKSEIALQQRRSRSAIDLANRALRQAILKKGNATGIWSARLQLARAYDAASVPLQLEVRLARWDSPTGRSQHQRELKELETDATAHGFLAIARFAREAAAR